jgi:hypothetical protein
MIKRILLLLFIWGATISIYAQSDSTTISRELKGGLRFQKTQKLYWENGFTIDYTCSRLWNKRIHLGLSYTTSRLGSAINSNAIKQDNYLFNASYHFMHTKSLHPMLRLNLGYFYADMENEIFEVIDHTAFMVSIDAGVYYQFDFPLTIGLTAGYNLSSGNGTTGPGSLYPIFYQMSLFYTLFKQ